MPIKFYNPTSPGRRAGSVLDYRNQITKSTPEKSLVVGKRRANGRNHHGFITAKHRGGGEKRLYRIIDFKRHLKDGMPAKVLAIEYDPNRSCHLALVEYQDGVKAYILAPNGLKVGGTVVRGREAGAVRGRGGTAGSARRGMGGDYSSQRRNASRPQRLPGDDRTTGEPGLDQREHWQGGPKPAHGDSAAHASQGDEPDRPSAGWW